MYLPQFMLWQNGNCTDITLDIGELTIGMIKEKNQRTATASTM